MEWNIVKWLSNGRPPQPPEVVNVSRNGDSVDFGVQSPQYTAAANATAANVTAEQHGQSATQPVADLRDSLRLERWNHESGATQSAMAYWRRNTRREQPTDSGVYNHLRGAGYGRFDPSIAEKSENSNQEKNNTVDLASFLVTNTKDGLYSLYANKVQKELEKRFLKSEQALSLKQALANDEALSASVAEQHSYRTPYVVEYFFGQKQKVQNDEVQGKDQTQQELDAAAAITAAEPSTDKQVQTVVGELNKQANIISTDETTLSCVPGSVLNEKMAAWWSASRNSELNETLHSIASSPDCDDMIAEEAPAPETQWQPYWKNCSQTDTLDRLPYAQCVDVRIAVADHPDTGTEVFNQLAHDENPDVRFAIAENHNVGREILNLLINDENPYVANRARRTLQRLAGGKTLQVNFAQPSNRAELQQARGSRNV